ncbi:MULTISPECIES: hypothetical protein [Calothrix]|uniref:Uncharacterized protein n=2 Tax=Calothrix TaxID=1186 RepID=A0ABR8ACX6_9CYAN|nr:MULTISPECIES: hypothetical protein [Calothrix]MBD2197763.1 hypothetical protein [Calothrix parietina FACHB-288]MBD2226167.1 hypothetical protein [Calothrix anomala FACHB-343]
MYLCDSVLGFVSKIIMRSHLQPHHSTSEQEISRSTVKRSHFQPHHSTS